MDYYCEEYGLYNGIPVTRAEYDDDAAEINGEIVNFEGNVDLRIRYLTPYNFVVCAKFHPFNSKEGDKFTRKGLNAIIKGELSIDSFAYMSEELPKNSKDY